jgi:hypothetical protein
MEDRGIADVVSTIGQRTYIRVSVENSQLSFFNLYLPHIYLVFSKITLTFNE